MSEVSIPRGALVALITALVVALVALAFLLGRASAPTAIPPAAEASPPPSYALASPRVASDGSTAETGGRPTLPLDNATPLSAARPPADMGQPPVAEPPAPPSAPPAAPQARPAPVSTRPAEGRVAVRAKTGPSEGNVSVRVNTSPDATTQGPTADPATRAQVAAYFREMDNIQPGQLSGDPQSMAQEMLQGAMSGDTRQLDDMIRKAEASERRARAITPPAPCVAFHARAVKLTGESVKMVRTLRQSIVSGDTTALLGMNAQAAQMQSEAQQLEREEEQLKQRYR